MTENELMAGHILRTSLSEASNLILTNYLKRYQPGTLEEVFRYLESDFRKRQDSALKKYRETDHNIYKDDYCDWEEEVRMVGNAREFYEEQEIAYPTPEGEVAFRYKYPPQRVEAQGDELYLSVQLERLFELCDELEELVERFKILFLPTVPNYTEDIEYLLKYTELKQKYEDLSNDISSNRMIERSMGWNGLSIVEKNQYVDNKKEQLERRILLLQKELM